VGMANVLNEEKKQQVLALGRLGWSLRRIQQATGIRRETAGTYLKAAGIAVRPPSGWGRCDPKPANEVITDSAVVSGPSAMLDRLLHHGHVLKCGPRSWRTKLDATAE
jgi:hypothetical protein